MKTTTPRYSGKKSQAFWDRVNALPEPEARVVYYAATLLQEMEERVLRRLDLAEQCPMRGQVKR